MDGASDGVIYFSLGTNIICSELSPEIIDVFITAFSELPYKILWKWDLDTLAGKPDNVMISKWFPQQDILGKNLLLHTETTFQGKFINSVSHFSPTKCEVVHNSGRSAECE